MKLRHFIPLALALLSPLAFAQEKAAPDPADPKMKEALARFTEATKLMQSLKYQTGEIALKNGEVMIKLTDGFRFLGPDDSKTVLTKIWQNPPEAASRVMGMLVPANVNLLESWAVTIEANDEGYVKDDDYEKTDFNDMLKELKEGSIEASKERESQGYGKMILTGWAEPPHYEKATHKLYWAKAFDVGDPDEQALNYDIRILGRRSNLELSVVGNMSMLAEIKEACPELLKMIEFQQGHRYEDFNASTDKVATYGIAGLIAGGVLAKSGFFKVLLVFLAKFSKVILVALVAAGAGIRKMLAGRKSETTYQQPPE